MLPIALGLGAATCIGFSNIVAGLTARRLTPLIVGFWSQATGTVWCALLLLALRPPLVSGQITGGLIAGLAGGAGMVLFYQSMTALRSGHGADTLRRGIRLTAEATVKGSVMSMPSIPRLSVTATGGGRRALLEVTSMRRGTAA